MTAKAKELATAVIHWLSEFPNSPIQAATEWSLLTDPITIFAIFSFFSMIEAPDRCHKYHNHERDGGDDNDDDDDDDGIESLQLPYTVQVLFSTKYSFMSDISSINVELHLMQQIERLDFILHNHLRRKLDMNLTPHLNFYKLVLLRDAAELKHLCQLLLIIGTHTSKEAAYGQSYIEFLSEEDRAAIQRDEISRFIRSNRQDTQLNRVSATVEFDECGGKSRSDHHHREDDDDNDNYTSEEGSSSYFISEDVYKTMKWENALLGQVLGRLAFKSDK
ncbi:uncharacterized protein LODBEIA_P05610 [Lodderomyces beijingensis]|uniref:Uncharacterized protein n=1 Tax=Lodderomyces beijingensis TaxID=1775926 RepID=A0ABP0ZFY1_9ASCO